MAKWEGSAADKKADKKNAKKAGVSVKKWEGSKGDDKADTKARKAMAKRKSGRKKK